MGRQRQARAAANAFPSILVDDHHPTQQHESIRILVYAPFKANAHICARELES
jgi:hypothetical protein